MPRWGATVLTVEATLKDNDQIVGKANASRNITAGGGYTIGAWKYVYDDIAADLISDLKKQREAQAVLWECLARLIILSLWDLIQEATGHTKTR